MCLFALAVICSAEEEKKTEKRGILDLGYPYGGLGHLGAPLASTYHGGYGLPLGAPLGYPHGLGLPYAAPAFLPKVATPLGYPAPLGFASPLHAPIVHKAIAPISPFGYPGYSSPYLGLGGIGHGISLLH